MNRLKNSYSTCMSCGGKKMKSGGKWIQSAIKKPGSFTAQAKKAGMSVPAFRDKVLSNKEKFSSTTVKRANLAKTLSKMRKGEDGMQVLSDRETQNRLNQEMANPMGNMSMESPSLPRVQAIDPLNMAAKTTLNKMDSLSAEKQRVQNYQQMLRSKGFNIAVDGVWGKETQKAYESYIKSKTAPAAKSTVKPAAKSVVNSSAKTIKTSYDPAVTPSNKYTGPYSTRVNPAVNTRSYSDNTRLANPVRPYSVKGSGNPNQPQLKAASKKSNPYKAVGINAAMEYIAKQNRK